MIKMDNEFPKGISIGPAATVPKRLAAALGAEAAVKRSTTKRAALFRSMRVEKKNKK